MELLIVFILFAAGMTLSLVFDLSMLLPLALGMVLFTLLAVRRGHSLRAVLGFMKSSLRDSFIVIGILLIIGCLTGMWRLSGTIAYFISLGVSLIPPKFFLLAAFLLASVMSYALGTSFGVSATAGVILISIARAGGVNPVLAAGAILSGVYVGDRGSPAASSANLVAVLTHTDMRDNVRKMLRYSILPYGICVVFYGILSFPVPMQAVSSDLLDSLGNEFAMQWYCLIPAILMIVLPFCKLSIRWSMVVSLLASVGVAVLVQGESILACLRAMLLGYTAKNAALADSLSGGGVVSMLEVCGILLLSGTYGGTFRGTGMLSAVNTWLSRMSGRIGRFPVMLLLGFGVSAIFCNQTIAAIMQSQLSEDLYGESETERSSKMMDMENSVILLAALVPWCIASSVPVSMLGADARSLSAAIYLWLVPLLWLIRGKGKKHEIH